MLQKLIREYSNKERFGEEEDDEDKKDTKEKKKKKEKLVEEDDKENEDEGVKMTAKKETYADKQLNKNLFIINTFEDVHDRKIKTDELKHFTELFADNDISKKVMKDKIENYENEKFSSNADNLTELLEVSKKLTSIIEKMKSDSDNKTDNKPESEPEKAVEKYKNFQGIMPFSNEKKYMLI
jgi:hypothetical protein